MKWSTIAECQKNFMKAPSMDKIGIKYHHDNLKLMAYVIGNQGCLASDCHLIQVKPC